MLDKLGRNEEALQDFSQALEIDEQNAIFWHNRACCYRNKGLLNEALHDFGVAIKLDPSNAAIYANRGQVYRKLEMYDQALEDYAAEIQAGALNAVKAYNNRAYCHAKLARYKDAIADYTKVLDLDPMKTHAMHNRGISYQRVGEFELVLTSPMSIGNPRLHCSDPPRPL